MCDNHIKLYFGKLQDMLGIVFMYFAENQISANPKMYYFDIITVDAIL